MLESINTFLWLVASLLIFVAGIYFTFKIRFAQFNFIQMFKSLRKKSEKGAITPLQTLTMNLAARIGVGSITGVALAIYVGGVGTLFWMWITAFVASSTTFIESVLSVIYQKKDEGNIYKGGPSYYIESGLKKKNLANFYSLAIIIAFIIGFLTIQSNTMTIGIIENINIPPIIVGLIIAILIWLVIVKGVKNIAKVTNILVPVMGIIYFIICMYIILINFDKFPDLIKSVFIDAFNFKSAGIGVLTTFLIGMQKGIFSNEAGLGTGAIASATTKTNNPASQGYIQSLGIFVDTLIFGTLSAFVVMLSDFTSLNIIDANGIEIAKYAFTYHLGEWGNILLLGVIILFAFATIITGYYYGESSLKFIKKNTNKSDLMMLKFTTLFLLVLGSITSSSLIWKFVDIFVAILAIVNIYALWKLKDKVMIYIKKNKR